ncbi:1-acyl-sn-glycerol-3-phosphate acyltransferase [Mycolicibacterium llatzerense]|uniref:1-acyl-sn-glycerol-3-phosphate acyltransferase n=1 Tax=Mycolicibacterium llatzerense TaxID=280871 RepID=UPI0021B6ADB3|nr:1-acyl-sn-glycerol-3-phosphate acyltransferase [Mycolicibacterium llatzerense]
MISSPAANVVPLDRRSPRHRRSAPIDHAGDVRWIGTAAQEQVVSAAFGDDRAAAVVSQGIERSDRVPPAAAVLGELAALTSFACRRLIGDYRVDDFGYDAEFAERVVLPMLRPLLNGWFRAEVVGLDNVPADGPALIVANHAGVLPLDALMTSVAIHDRHRAHRTLRILAADLVFALPVLAPMARKAGHTLACVPDAHRLLCNGELAAVFPEGYKGLGKRFGDRYRLARFGRGGFAAAALRAGAPIVPCAIVGSEEIYPMVANLGPLARVLGLPYFPITPTFPLTGLLGLVPLPSKWYIEFGTPIPTSGCADADDPMAVFDLADRVRQTVGTLLRQRLAVRRNVFAG